MFGWKHGVLVTGKTFIFTVFKLFVSHTYRNSHARNQLIQRHNLRNCANNPAINNACAKKLCVGNLTTLSKSIKN